MTSPKQDNYALDDTLAGRITQATAVAIMTSYPDWIKNKTALVSAYVLSFLGFGALVAITNAESHEGESEPEKPEVSLWALPVGLGALVVGGWLGIKAQRGIVSFIRRRGVAKPWTVWGGIGAAIVFILSELEARENAARN